LTAPLWLISCIIYITDYIRQHGTNISFPADGKSWVILSGIEQRIKEKIEKIGKPLKDWDISINYGIKTGCNEAFIIDKAKRDELIAKDAKSAEIIRPILRGRDIKRYSYEFAEKYVILVRKGTDIDKYSAIKEHLTHFYKPLNAKAGCNKWYELQASPSNKLIEDFSKQKIVWAETMRIHKDNIKNFPRFSFINKDFFIEKTCFFAVGNKLLFILAYLNSPIGRYLFKRYVSILDNGGYLMQKISLEPIPIAVPNKNTLQEIEKLCKKNLSSQNIDIENEINKKIYTICNLTEEEITYIEKNNLDALSR
jgi:hypothetical protein